MAFESYYWRKNIKRDITEIRKMMLVNLNVLEGEKFDEVFSKVEIKIFMMAFSIRKLLETRKLPDSVLDATIKVTKFKRNTERAGWFFDFDKLFDFTRPIKEDLKLKYFLNQIIHSHVFQTSSTRKGNLSYLYFTSDKKRKEWLYLIRLETLLKFIEKIAKQEVTHMETKYDESTGEFITKTR